MATHTRVPTWSREGGFRWGWLARLTDGRWGLGRWTQAEIDDIRARAKRLSEELDWGQE